MGVSHPILSHDPVTWLTTLSAIAGTWITLYFKVIRPRQQEHLKHQADRDDERKAEKFLRGLLGPEREPIPWSPAEAEAIRRSRAANARFSGPGAAPIGLAQATRPSLSSLQSLD